jgi:hypothetical protein
VRRNPRQFRANNPFGSYPALCRGRLSPDFARRAEPNPEWMG